MKANWEVMPKNLINEKNQDAPLPYSYIAADFPKKLLHWDVISNELDLTLEQSIGNRIHHNTSNW